MSHCALSIMNEQQLIATLGWSKKSKTVINRKAESIRDTWGERHATKMFIFNNCFVIYGLKSRQ